MTTNTKQIKVAVVIMLVLVLVLVTLVHIDWFWRLIYPVKYEEIIVQSAREYNLDPLLILSIIYVESRFVPDARSHKGALGLMQIMPGTAEWIAGQMGIEDFRSKDLLDPEKNIRYGSWYLQNLLQEFDNQLIIALAAYNAGRGNVGKWLGKHWDGKPETINDLPFNETRHYVNKILQVYRRYQEIYQNHIVTPY